MTRCSLYHRRSGLCSFSSSRSTQTTIPALLVLCLALTAILAGCNEKVKADPRLEAPPPAKVESELDASLVKVDHPDQFPLVTAGKHVAAPELNVTGTVAADVSRAVPVISLASGRIIEIHARLGDTVTKGQLMLKVQSPDISQAFSDYRQAKADEKLTKAQLDRAKILYEKGAIAQKDLEVAEDAEAKTVVTVETALDHLKVLGADPNHPTQIIEIVAPISGVVTDQQVTNASGTQGLASPNSFTISDLSQVWIICDVYENYMSFVHVGEYADIHLNAYPKLVLKGRISNIGPGLDPTIRTAKVRLEVPNPGMLRLGMFVTATFHGMSAEVHTMAPASAILHLHDRDWVYTPVQAGQFRRVEVTGGKMLPGGMQEIVTGLKPGQQVVANALVLQNTVEQ
jgi:cobalt-zinc-cadmium efflux system membrane fusion protein